MRIYSWNVNGLRSAQRKGFAAWLANSGAQVVALQEVRAREEQLPDEVRSIPGWHSHFVHALRPGYSGVGLYTRSPWDSMVTSIEHRAFDAEGRVQVASLGKLLLVNCYFPNGNGKDRDLSRIPFKLRFYKHLFRRLLPQFEQGRRILVMGDFNTAHTEDDLARPKENRENSGFRPEERREFTRWLDAGWVDTFRHFQKAAGHYTWWSQRFGIREKNIGWRIDYVLASPAAAPYLRAAAIHPEIRGSDHCPISVDLDSAVLR